MSNKLTVKDLINVGVFTALYIVIFFVSSFVGYIPLLMVLLPVICAVVVGIPFMLFLSKVHTFGMVKIMSIILGLFTLLLGRPWPVLLIAVIAGMIADLVMKSGNYKSVKLSIIGSGIFSMDAFNELHPMALSGGQKQRVAIACGLASDKEIILLDEPTSGLDYMHMKQVADVLRMLRERGKTVLIITHDLELISCCAAHVLHLEKGSVHDNYAVGNTSISRMKEFFVQK